MKMNLAKPVLDKSIWAVPLNLRESLQIRDGLATVGPRRIPAQVLQTLQAHINRFRFKGLCLN